MARKKDLYKCLFEEEMCDIKRKKHLHRKSNEKKRRKQKKKEHHGKGQSSQDKDKKPKKHDKETEDGFGEKVLSFLSKNVIVIVISIVIAIMFLWVIYQYRKSIKAASTIKTAKENVKNSSIGPIGGATAMYRGGYNPNDGVIISPMSYAVGGIVDVRDREDEGKSGRVEELASGDENDSQEEPIQAEAPEITAEEISEIASQIGTDVT